MPDRANRHMIRAQRRQGVPIVALKDGGYRLAETDEDKKALLDMYRKRALDERLPWAHLDMGFNEDYLWQEWQRAAKEASTKGCFAGCRRCGICKEGREAW